MLVLFISLKRIKLKKKKTKAEMLTFDIKFNIALEAVARVRRQKNKARIWCGKGEISSISMYWQQIIWKEN